MSEEVSVGGRRQLRGRVVSDKMDKTIIVAVERQFKHPRYRKYVTRVSRYAAHDAENKYKVDDVVTIEESRPLSRTKRWIVVDESEAS